MKVSKLEDLNILIVDDDDPFREVLADLAGAVGYKVQCCADGSEALKSIRQHSFDLIITDLMMPGANGLEVLRAARQNQPEALVIIITGHASLQTAIEAIREGAYDYIRKPFKLEEMELALKNAGERIGLLRENKRLLTELQRAYEQVELVKEIIQVPSTHDPRTSNGLSQGLDLLWQRGEPFIPGNRLPLSSLQVRSHPSTSILERLERLDALLEKGRISQTEFRLLKTKLLEKAD